MARAQPVFLRLTQIRFPLMALVSILHRVSGLILVLAMPVFVYFLSQSLHSAETYQHIVDGLDSLIVKLATILVTWSFGHHTIAGIRFLLIDFYGKPTQGKDSARWVLIASGLVFLLAVIMVLS